MRWSIENGYDLVIWTFDPARSKNAWLNIGKLGVITDTYLVDHYGVMEDELNKGVPSDRFMVEWWIKSPWIEERPKYKFDSDLKFEYKTALSLKRTDGDTMPSEINYVDTEYVAVEIPIDFDNLGERTRELKVIWKYRMREAFQYYFQRGYKVVYFVRGKLNDRGIYLLKRGFDPYDKTTW